jgi:hypothetical protein
MRVCLMNYLQLLRGIKNIYDSFFEVVTPECLNRGSSPQFAWIPLKACGNDGL